ncbi:DUF305 domain-containing protein [Patulibacter sp. SYSU D01012]|uniref:DUF305 domain-containing protein n=1 Tax=Patulibacter sp. SYSU D01012 TaxID=2817381 RepID=UPI001B307678|nr:DUF305 domain-containing protein [Patulibacter sp. SYSU D01012]
MRPLLHPRPRAAALLALALVVPAAGCGGQAAGEHGQGATTAESTARVSDVDRAFVGQMVPHHEMAVAMARDAGRRATHAPLRALAADVVRDQRAEIAELRALAGELRVHPGAGGGAGAGHDHGDHDAMAEDAETLGLTPDETGMSMDMAALQRARPYDRAFIDAMVPHHQGAIRMARAELEQGTDPRLQGLARRIVRAQEREIRRMNGWRRSWYGAPSPAGGGRER